MMKLLRQPSTGYEPCSVKATGESVYVCRADQDNGDLHVSELNATEESAVRMLDAIAREAFPQIQLKANTIHLLSAPAGGGKTTLTIDLSRQLIANNDFIKLLIMTFNKCASVDGAHRTEGEDSIEWRTIDAVIWNLYKDQFEEDAVVEVSDAASLCTLAKKVLQKEVSIDDVQTYVHELAEACNTGKDDGLRGDARAIFDAGMRGEWWSYSMLRLRALDNDEWVQSLKDYSCIMVDEAQDLNPVMIGLLRKVHRDHMVVYIRDRAQKLYTFLGNEDITEHLDKQTYRDWNVYLTFRYGMTVCKMINAKGLASCITFPHESVEDTQVTKVDDDFIVPGSHVYLLSTWVNILETADTYLNKGRMVGIDAEKKEDMLKAARQTGWSKYDSNFFKRIPKHRVIDILERCISEGDELCELRGNVQEPDGIVILTTLHSYKGLEADIVRVSRCIMVNRKAKEGVYDDHRERIYVAITRVKKHLYIPTDKDSNKRKYNK